MKILLVVLVGLTFVACNNEVKRDTPRSKDLSKQAKAASVAQTENPLSGTVEKAMDASKYTYALINNGKESVWVAGPTTKVEVGQKIAAGQGMLMQNFESKTLNKTFEKIYFVSNWYKADVGILSLRRK
jgi:hypothetical protein